MVGVEREYDYKPRWTVIVFCAAFFGLAAVILGAKGAGNDRGVILEGTIELGPGGATAFYYALAACSIGFVAVAGFLTYHRLAYRQRIAFGPTALLVPKSRWSRGEVEIAYRDIRSLSEATVGGQRFLYVAHAGGKHTVTASLLPSKAAFEEVCELLADKARDARPDVPRHA